MSAQSEIKVPVVIPTKNAGPILIRVLDIPTRQDLLWPAVGKKINFVQDDYSKSVKGVLRGLHYQLPPKAQGKLVRVIQGEVFDVVLDIRRSSPTFGKWVSEIISSDNKKQIWIPEDFAHGFLVISDTAEFLYKTTDLYGPDHETCILWNDKNINIKWPFNFEPVLANKDKLANSFNHAKYFE